MTHKTAVQVIKQSLSSSNEEIEEMYLNELLEFVQTNKDDYIQTQDLLNRLNRTNMLLE